MKLAKYFTWSEVIKSATADRLGLSNLVLPEHERNVQITARYMDKVREILGGPVIVTSWYRNPQVNKAVGGVPNSQHAKGEAVDFVCPSFGSPWKIFERLKATAAYELPFDQLILEPSWVHISFRASGGIPRRQAFVDSRVGE